MVNNVFVQRWACLLRNFCWSYAVGVLYWAVAVFSLTGGGENNLLKSRGWFVGLAQFFVGVVLSDFPVRLSQFFVWAAAREMFCWACVVNFFAWRRACAVFCWSSAVRSFC